LTDLAVNDGREAIVERCQLALGGLDSSQHLLGNHWVEVDGDTARAGCYLHAQHHLVSPSGLNTSTRRKKTDTERKGNNNES
jgi:hypothetical protein